MFGIWRWPQRVPIEEGVVADGFKKEWSTLIVGFNSVLESLGGLIKK